MKTFKLHDLSEDSGPDRWSISAPCGLKYATGPIVYLHCSKKTAKMIEKALNLTFSKGKK